MFSTRSRILLAATAAAATVGTTAGLASPGSDSQLVGTVSVDQATVARHRALGQLSEPIHVITDSAMSARHRALGRLPLQNPIGGIQSETTESGSFPWEASLLCLAAVAACLIVGFAVARTRVLHVVFRSKLDLSRESLIGETHSSRFPPNEGGER